MSKYGADEEVIHANPYEHFKLRPEMYIAVGMSGGPSLAYNPDVGFGNIQLSWDAATLHFAKEIVANALDAVIKSGNTTPIRVTAVNIGEYPNNATRYSVANYAKAIPRGKMAECLVRPRTGTNFKEITGIGRNGYGTKVVLALSTQFDAVCRYHDGTFDHLMAKNDGTYVYTQNLKEVPKGMYPLKEEGTYIKYTIPSGPYNQACSIRKIESTLIEFSMSLNVAFTLNGNLISHNWSSVVRDSLHISGDICLKCSHPVCSCTGNERYRFHVMEPLVGDTCPIMGFVNGLRCDQGKHISTITKEVNSITRAFLEDKKIKGDIPKFRIFVNLTCLNPSQEGQVKGKLNDMRDITLPSLKAIVKWPCMESILKQNRKKVLGAAKSLRVIDNTSYIPAKNPNGVLLLGEGVSVLGYLHRVRSKMPNICGIYTLRGKCLNCESATPESIAKNAVIIGLASALGLSLIDTDVAKCRYKRIVIAADADDDGLHIATLIVGIFTTLWPEIVTNGLLYYLSSPILKAFNSKGEIVKRYYSQPTSPIGNGLGIKYYKGLGSSNDDDIDDDYVTAPVYRIANHGDEDMAKFKATMRSTAIRKNVITGPDTPDREIEYTTLANIRNEPDETLSLGDVIHQMYRRYMLRSMLRALPGAKDGLKDCLRKIMYTVLSSSKKSYKVEALANQTSSGTAYHHGPASLANAIVLVGRKFDNNLPLLRGDGQFGTVKGNDDANPRYLKVDVPAYLRPLFSLHDIYPNQVCEGSKIEPKILQPILPLVLLNSGSGIASGWAYKSLGTTPQVLISCIKNYLNSKAYDYKVVVGEGQTATRLDPSSWELRGTMTKTGTKYRLRVPAPGKTFQQGIELVQKYARDHPELLQIPIAEYHDGKLELDHIPETLASQIEFYKFNFNLNFMDPEGVLMSWETPELYLNYYVDEVLHTYGIRRENLIRANRRLLAICNMKIEYIRETRARPEEIKDIAKLEQLIIDSKWERDIVSRITDFDKTEYHLNKLLSQKAKLEAFVPQEPKDLYLKDLMELETFI